MPVRAIFSIVGRSGPGIAIAVAGLVLVVAIGGSAVVPDLITQVEEKRGGEDMDEYLKIKTTQNRNI